jgi:hypothetical protein
MMHLETHLIHSPVGLVIMGRMMGLAMVWRAMVWVALVRRRRRVMRVVVILLKVNDTVVKR